jgi:hypothetical protein
VDDVQVNQRGICADGELAFAMFLLGLVSLCGHTAAIKRHAAVILNPMFALQIGSN